MQTMADLYVRRQSASKGSMVEDSKRHGGQTKCVRGATAREAGGKINSA